MRLNLTDICKRMPSNLLKVAYLSHPISEIDQSVATDVVLHIREIDRGLATEVVLQIRARPKVWMGDSLQMLSEPSYH